MRLPNIRKHLINTTLLLIYFLLPLSAAKADTAAVSLDIINSTTDESSNNTTQGWAFQVTKEITLTKLGFYDHNSDGLNEVHQVAIWQAIFPTPPLIVATSIPSGSATELLNGFRYVDISPTVLTPNNTYVIGAHMLTSADLVIVDATSFAPNTTINWINGRVPGTSEPGFVYPGTPVNDNSRFGPNFMFEGAVTVSIDIKPNSDKNCVNINGHGVIPVAILGSPETDTTLIDFSTLVFNGLLLKSNGEKCDFNHVNDDTYLDLVCKFEDNTDNWIPTNDKATMTGLMMDGTEIEGEDVVCRG